MRRSAILGVIGAVLVIGVGAYSVFWWIAAGRIKHEAENWATQTAPKQQLAVSWQTIRVAGYPFGFHIDLTNALIRSEATGTAGGIHAAAVSANIAPWNLHAITFAAPKGLDATIGPTAAPIGRVNAARASAAFAIGNDGRSTVWLSLFDMKASAGDDIAARILHGWASWPRTAPASHTEPSIAVAALARDLAVPTAPPGFSNTIDELSFGLTAMGAIPSGPPRQAAAAWRDAGGTVELDHFNLRWGQMAINGTGTVALDSDLQPVGGFSGGVSGYGQLMNALVAAGRVKANDARLAQMALAMIARAGADGRPEISTALTIQNGEMRLGPIKAGKISPIPW